MSQAEEGGVGAEDVGPSGQPSRTHGPTRAAHASVKGEDHTNTTNDDDTILRCSSMLTSWTAPSTGRRAKKSCKSQSLVTKLCVNILQLIWD